jgi:1-acyl-sn-glycerol-3-phosphate acyltransferase
MLRTLYAWTVGVVYTLFWSTLGILTWPLSPRGDLYLKFARIWSGWILASLGIPIEVERSARLDSHRTYLFMSNHRSAFDIFALFRAIDHPFRMIAKRGLFFIPIFGWSLWMCGFIPINRSNRESAIKSLHKAAHRMRNGLSVLVFPEGTRGTSPTIQPFKKGGFYLALQSEAPVVPVVLLGTDRILPKGGSKVNRGSITVRIGEPIETAGLGIAARDRLMGEVRSAMERLAETHSEAAAPSPRL